MDQSTRNLLRNTITQCRKLLEDAVKERLEGTFGILSDGRVLDIELDGESSEYRDQILVHLDHIKASSFSDTAAIEQLVREVSFTHLNRLCALKMMAVRGIIKHDPVGRGLKSRGFLFYLADHPEDEDIATSGNQDVAYRHYLQWLCGRLSEGIGALFTPNDPANRLFPSQHVLDAVLDKINSDELSGIWQQDETIGWVYQYFTPKELRDTARKESSAPRNSYELAFRNQFFTPRYVVQFLVDNTLGRMWYEMRQGRTRLLDQCEYMVRRYDEVFVTRPAEDDLFSAAHRGFFEASPESWPVYDGSPESDRRLWALAHSINGYDLELFEDVDGGWMAVASQVERAADLEAYKTQELLGILFMSARAVRHWGDGTISELPRRIDIGNEIRRRALASRTDDLTQEEKIRAPFFVSYRAPKDPTEIKIIDPACGSGHFLLYCFDLLVTIYEEAYENGPLRSDLREAYATLAEFRIAIPELILRHNLHGIDIDLRATQIAALALWLRAQRAYKDLGLSANKRPTITKTNFVCAEPMPGEGNMLEEFTAELRPRVLGQLVRVVFEKMKLAGEAGSLLKIEEELRDAIAEAKRQWKGGGRAEQLSLFAEEKRPRVEQMRLFDVADISDEQFWEDAEARVLEALEAYAHRIGNGCGLARQLFAEDTARGFGFIDLSRQKYDVVLMNPPFGEAASLSFDYISRAYPTWNSNVLCSFMERGWEILTATGMVGAIYDRTVVVKSTYEQFRREVLLREDRIFTMADLGWEVLDANVEVTTSVLSRARGPAVFFDVRDYQSESKGTHLGDLLTTLGQSGSIGVYIELSSSLLRMPNSVVGYDFPAFLIRAFNECPSMEEIGFKAYSGHTLQAEKHNRLWWEMASKRPQGSFYSWMFNGSDYSPYATCFTEYVYSDRQLDQLPKNTTTYLRNKDVQGKFGVCFSKRGEYLCAHLCPEGLIFTQEGRPIPTSSLSEALTALSLLNTPLFRFSINKYAGQHKSSGYVNVFPVRSVFNAEDCQRIVLRAIEAFRLASAQDEISPTFKGLQFHRDLTSLADHLEQLASNALTLQIAAEELCHTATVEAYCLSDQERTQLSTFRTLQPSPSPAIDGYTFSKRRPYAAQLLLSQMFGYIVGRWDLRYPLGEMTAPPLAAPLDSLPSCPPGMLQGGDGLPVCAPPTGYPLEIVWNGLLVDDPGHQNDIAWNVDKTLRLIWLPNHEEIEREACEILGVSELRDYFRKPGVGGFWMDHIGRYSKSRRKAPIYWLLQSSQKNYALWIYYHRLDKDCLPKALEYVRAKLNREEATLRELLGKRKGIGLGGKAAKDLEKEIDKQEAFVSEVHDFHDKLKRVTDLNLEPDLNDGVVLNIAPLWELVPWLEPKKYWQELVAGKYEWSTVSKQLRARGLVK